MHLTSEWACALRNDEMSVVNLRCVRVGGSEAIDRTENVTLFGFLAILIWTGL